MYWLVFKRHQITAVSLSITAYCLIRFTCLVAALCALVGTGDGGE